MVGVEGTSTGVKHRKLPQEQVTHCPHSRKAISVHDCNWRHHAEKRIDHEHVTTTVNVKQGPVLDG